MALTEIQKKWVDALRSGKYEQTTRALCRINDFAPYETYCCLGVACELYLQEFPDNLTKVKPTLSRRVEYGYNTEILPLEVKDWLGLYTQNGKFIDGDDEQSLSGLNDACTSFEKIADIIEEKADLIFRKET